MSQLGKTSDVEKPTKGFKSYVVNKEKLTFAKRKQIELLQFLFELEKL